jgi:phosphoribosylamine-glycine ligase
MATPRTFIWSVLVIVGVSAVASLALAQDHSQIKGENFPDQSKTPRGAGPELTGMGAHHPAEYFTESVHESESCHRSRA